MKKIEQHRDGLIKEWFSNLKKGTYNNSSLLLFNATQPLLNKIEDEFNKYEDDFTIIDYKLISFSNENKKNIIINISSEELAKDYHYIEKVYKILAKGVFLFIPEMSDFYNNFSSYCEDVQNENIPEMYSKRYFYYIENLEPYDFITKHKKNEIKKFLEFNLKHGLISLFKSDMEKYLYNQINVPNNDISKLNIDTELLESQNILTSRLAVVIFRMINNIQSTTTSIGRYYNKTTGSKSKTMNISLYMNEKSKFYKVYDLNVNDAEINIRKEIAEELLSLNLKQLDTNKIAKITKLPIKTVEKMMK